MSIAFLIYCVFVLGRDSRSWEIVGITPNQLGLKCCVKFCYYQNLYSDSEDVACEFCIFTVKDPENYLKTHDHTSMRLLDYESSGNASRRCKFCKIQVAEHAMMNFCDICIAINEAKAALASIRRQDARYPQTFSSESSDDDTIIYNNLEEHIEYEKNRKKKKITDAFEETPLSPDPFEDNLELGEVITIPSSDDENQKSKIKAEKIKYPISP